MEKSTSTTTYQSLSQSGIDQLSVAPPAFIQLSSELSDKLPENDPLNSELDLEMELPNEEFYLEPAFEADLNLELVDDDIPTGPVPPDSDRSAFLTNFPNLSWSFTSLQNHAKLYRAVLLGQSDKVFVKRAVGRLELMIKNGNLLNKPPYGIAPKPATFSYLDAAGTTVTKPMIATESPNDYISLAAYWWPDPNSPNGLPYIALDGKANPEASALPDHALLHSICRDIQLLGLGYYFTKNNAYAAQAATLLRAFFLNPTTRMNPHLMYGQVVQGLNNGYGRSIGFVDTELLPELLNGYQLMQEAPDFVAAPEIDTGLKEWFRSLWQWLTTDYTSVPAAGSRAFYHYQMIKEIKTIKNNIRCAFEYQLLSYALFIGEKEWAVKEINNIIKDNDTEKGLISNQILPVPGTFTIKDKSGTIKELPVPAGSMPKELKRTKPATYCQKNLHLLLCLCVQAENVGVDLYNYVSPEGSSIKKAVEAMLYFNIHPQEWPRAEYEDLADPLIYRMYRHTMRRASGAWVKDTALLNDIQTYLNNLDTLLGKHSGYSETAYRQGLDWQLLIHKIGYNF